MDLTRIHLIRLGAILELHYIYPAKRQRPRLTTIAGFMLSESSGWGDGVVRRWQYQPHERLRGVTFTNVINDAHYFRIVEIDEPGEEAPHVHE